jgi:BlaI family transcriptional regulator, penicillinase repressor
MPAPLAHRLSRREKQLMDALFRLGRATAAELREALADPPSYSAVRAHLRILEDKGHIRHEADGPRYIYLPRTGRDTERRRALTHLLDTFFGGSREALVSTLVSEQGAALDDEEVARLTALIAAARRREDGG